MNKKIVKDILLVFFSLFMITSVFFWEGLSVKASGSGAVYINSVSIVGANVQISVTVTDFPDSDDGVLYVYGEKTYQDSPAGAPVASVPIASSVTFSFPLGYGTAQCHLYEKFQLAVVQNGAVVPVCGARYISNPEALGSVTAKKNTGKKGLILDGAKIGNGNTEVLTLGVQQGAYNINLEDVVGGNGAVPYDYNGKTYYFDSNYLSQYDHCVRTTTNQGIGLTMVLLNPYSKGEEYMISPYARGGIGRSSYYLMNTSEDQGLETLEAVVSFLALRYNGKNGFGQVDNWVIGNEVNAKNVWNYASDMDIATYARLYADSLRVCYIAIKSRISNAVVCSSFDNEWTSTSNGAQYTARSLMEYMNAYIAVQGNFDWALAFHPYNYPMVWTSFWTPYNAKSASMIQHNIDSPYISMENIEQLTDYMCLSHMRNTKGEVRPILLTEVGYSSTQGEEAQAAAIVYAYNRAATNRYISMIIFNRQTDFPLEVKSGLSVGLTRQDGSAKLAFAAFKEMNSQGANSYSGWAANYAGIVDWSAAMNAR